MNNMNPDMIYRYFLIFSFMLSSIIFQGCSQTDSSNSVESLYYLNVARPGWDTTIYINGNPAFRGGIDSSVAKEMSPWIMEGSNSIRIETKRVSDSVFSRQKCDIRFVQVDANNLSSTKTLNGIYHSPLTADEYEAEFTIICENKIKWLWESADQIEEFSDADRKSIAQLIQKLGDAYRNKDANRILSLMNPVWGKGTNPEDLVVANMNYTEMVKKEQEVLQQIFDYSDYTVMIAGPDELEYFKGNKAVLITKKSGDNTTVHNQIVYIGHGPEFNWQSESLTWSISYDFLHFLKIDEKWILLAP